MRFNVAYLITDDGDKVPVKPIDVDCLIDDSKAVGGISHIDLNESLFIYGKFVNKENFNYDCEH